MFKRFFWSGRHSKEEQHQTATLEMLLSNEDPRDLLRWFKKNARKLDQSFVDTLADTSDRLLRQSSIASTQQLFRLNLLVNELFRSKLNESSQFQLVLIQKKLEEDGVGPRSIYAKAADDVYKRVYN